MPVYEYKGLNDGARSCTGVIDAETPREAREKLRLKRIYVTDIAAVGESAAASAKAAPAVKTGQPIGGRAGRGAKPEKRHKQSFIDSLGQSKRNADVAQFTRQLATLLKAGIPLTQSLNALVQQTSDKGMQTVIRDMREKINSGMDIAEVFAHHPRYFTPLFQAMVRAGEASGRLSEVLDQVAGFMQKQTRLRGKVMAAMTYPVILLGMAVLVVVFLMIFVVPKVTQLLEQQKIEMPLPTLIVTSSAHFMAAYWYLVIGALIGTVMLFRGWLSTEKGRYAWDKMKLKAPLIGGVFTKVSVSRFATTFSVLLKSGLTALEGLRIVKDVVGNVVLKEVIGMVHDSIIEGTDISTPLKKSGVFPPVVGYMIAVGEQTGELENLLDRVSEAYDEEVDLSVQKMTAALEPIMIVFMAVTVGTIIAAVMMPLMKISAGG